jgi:hypothetical protein
MKLKKFMPLVKMVDKPDGSLYVYGLVTAEKPDLDKEVCDYFKTKPLYQAKAEAMKKATAVEGMEQSIMPMRSMHTLDAIGKGVEMHFDDAAKTIHMGFEVVDPLAITKFKKGVFVGFSQGGDYVQPKEWPSLKIKDPVYKGCVRYVSNPGEVSGVDSPCLPEALVATLKASKFEYVKSDGSTRLMKFHSPALAKKPASIHIDASQVDAGILKVNDKEYEVCDDPNAEVSYGERYWKQKGPSTDQRLAKIETLLHKALQKDGVDYDFDDAIVGEDQQCECSCPECAAGNCADCSHAGCDCDNCQCPIALDLTQKVAKGITPGPGMPEKPTPAVGTMEANVPKDAGATGDLSKDGKKTKRVGGKDLPASAFAHVGDPDDPATWKLPIHDKAHAQNALARFNQTQGIPDDQKKKVKNKIVAAAKEHGIDVAEEAAKFHDALEFVKMREEAAKDPLKKCMADVHDLAGVLQTLRVVTNWQAMEATEEKGASSVVPAHLHQLLEDAVAVFRELVEEETAEILATTSGGGNEEHKAMTTEELQKAASAHLKKAMEMVKAHCDHLGAVSKAHMENVSSLNQAHGAAMNGAGSVTACKSLHKAHSDHMDGVHKAHHDHMVALGKAHHDAMADHFGKANSPDAEAITTAATNDGEVKPVTVAAGSQGAYPGAPHSKALTTEDLTKAVTDGIAKAKEQWDKDQTETLTAFAKALVGEMETDGAAPTGGIGDRNSTAPTKVHATHPVTKAGEMTDSSGQPLSKGAEAPVIAPADVMAAVNGDQTALLKMARGIKANPSGVPQSLMNTKLMHS